MRVDDVLTIARKDLRSVWRKRGIRYALLIFPMTAAVTLPSVIGLVVEQRPDLPPVVIERMMQSFLFFFMIAVTTLPTAIASYSIVGEKMERSLEPLLATPVGIGSILGGKMLAAVVPTLLAVWMACGVFMVMANGRARPLLGYGYFPQGATWIELLVLMPLMALLTVNIDIIVSARVADVRSAQQIAGLTVLPVSAIYVSAQLGSLGLDAPALWRLSAIVLVLDVVTYIIARRVFDREEILTRWA